MRRRYSDEFLDGIKPDSLVNAVRRQESRLAALQYEVVRLRRLSAIAQEGGALDRADFGSAVLDASGVHTDADMVDINWWLPLNLSVDDISVIYAVCRSGDYIYVGGAFSRIGGVDASNIARYSLVTRDWEEVGGGVNELVLTVAADSNGVIYIGGNFTNAGDDPDADYIAKLEDGAWVAVGGGFSTGNVFWITFDGDDVPYVCGTMTGKIVYLDGGSWTVLGTGIGSTFVVRRAIFDADGVLYIGGSFTGAGSGADVNRVAKLVDGDWENVGGGVNTGQVMAMAFDANGVLYIGGNFLGEGSAGDADYLARLVDDDWQKVGEGLNHHVHALILGDDDRMYIGGSFYNAGGDPRASNIVYLGDNDVFHGLSNAGGMGGLNFAVYTILPMENGSIIAGGIFYSAGAIQCDSIAIYCKPLNEAIDLIAALFELYASYDASAYIEDAPADGNLYARKDNDWEVILPAAIDGWRAMPTQPARNSADDPTYVAVWTNTNYMSLLQEGLPVKWTQNSIVRYGFISAAPVLTAGVHTTITILTRLDGSSSDYDMLDTGTYPISNFCIGLPKQPGLGFPALSEYWDVLFTDTGDRSVSSPGTSIVNPNSMSVTVPIGDWEIILNWITWVAYTGTNTRWSVVGGLGTANNSFLSDLRYYFLATSTDLIANGGYDVSGHYHLTAKQTYYLNVQTGTSGATSIRIRGDISRTKVRARCRYL